MTHDFRIHILILENEWTNECVQCMVRFSFGFEFIGDNSLSWFRCCCFQYQCLPNAHVPHVGGGSRRKNMNAQEFYNCIPQTLNIVSVINVFDLVSEHVKNDRANVRTTNASYIFARVWVCKSKSEHLTCSLPPSKSTKWIWRYQIFQTNTQ